MGIFVHQEPCEDSSLCLLQFFLALNHSGVTLVCQYKQLLMLSLMEQVLLGINCTLFTAAKLGFLGM